MDLSNLSSDLPPTKPINQASINELNREATTEFKNAAKSVASLYNSSAGTTPSSKHKTEFANAAKSVAALYRVTNNANGLLRPMGYLECVDDLLKVITNGEDIENWALTKRAEITNISNNASEGANSNSGLNQELKDVAADVESVDEGLHIPLDYAFSFSLDLVPAYNFRPSFPPLSVSHSHKQRTNLKQMKSDRLARMKMNQKQQQLQCQSLEDSCTTSDECDSDLPDKDLDEIDPVSLKKKKSLDRESDVKRRRTNISKDSVDNGPTN